jgi:hypothetical protein
MITVEQKALIDQLRFTASRGISAWGDLQVAAAQEIEVLVAEREAFATAMDRMNLVAREAKLLKKWNKTLAALCHKLQQENIAQQKEAQHETIERAKTQ